MTPTRFGRPQSLGSGPLSHDARKRHFLARRLGHTSSRYRSVARLLLFLGAILLCGAVSRAVCADFDIPDQEIPFEERKKRALESMTREERAQYEAFLKAAKDQEAAERYAVEMAELCDKIDDIEKRKDSMSKEEYRQARDAVYGQMRAIISDEMPPPIQQAYLDKMHDSLEKSGYPWMPKPEPKEPHFPSDFEPIPDEKPRDPREIEEALRKAEALLKADPKNVQALVAKGQALSDLKDYAGAAAQAREALRLDPNNANALALLQLSASRASGIGAPSPQAPAQGASPAPGEDGPQGEPLRPGLGLPELSKRLDTALKIGDYPAVHQIASRILEAYPDMSQVYGRRAEALLHMGRYAEALEDLDKAFLGAPEDPRLHLMRAIALTRLRRYAEAAEAAKKALGANDKLAEAWRALAHAEAGLKQREEALRALRRAAELNARAFGPIYKRALDLPQTSDLLSLFEEAAPPPAQEPPRRNLPAIPILLIGRCAAAAFSCLLLRRGGASR
ncbi:MAG: tetratricopeptide repeat protein, partial [Elusimicrobia bacterium]|nr:tetratricopeptide repeat protein [Elusimicrobiota bacterium]